MPTVAILPVNTKSVCQATFDKNYIGILHFIGRKYRINIGWTVKPGVLSQCSVSFILSSNVAWKFVQASLFASDISSVDDIDILHLLNETVRPFILQSNNISQVNTS
jgi:hypothetical protein